MKLVDINNMDKILDEFEMGQIGSTVAVFYPLAIKMAIIDHVNSVASSGLLYLH